MKQFTLLKPALEALQSGKATKIEKLEDLISDGLEALKSQVEADDKLAALEEMKSGERKLKTDRIRLMSNLVTLGMDGKKLSTLLTHYFRPEGSQKPGANRSFRGLLKVISEGPRKV